jgi:hypothetical protein
VGSDQRRPWDPGGRRPRRRGVAGRRFGDLINDNNVDNIWNGIMALKLVYRKLTYQTITNLVSKALC